MSVTLDKILSFVSLTHLLQKIERRIRVTKSERFENDLEHQYQLALVAWYLAESANLDLDISKIIKYALIHDFVEAYAGDADFCGDRTGKEEKEKEAAARIKKEFPEFPELHQLIEDYEKKENRESKFVYALDKLLPIYNIYLDDGRTWKERGLNLEAHVIAGKKDKIHLSPEVEKHFKEIIPKLKEREKDLFG